MTLEYKAVKMNSPLRKDGRKEQYYPRLANRQKRNIRDVAERISEVSSFSTMDVLGILEAFVTQVPYFLLDNCSVELGDLGTFSLHIGGEGVEYPEKMNASKVKSVKMAFRPSSRVKRELQKAKFRKVESK